MATEHSDVMSSPDPLNNSNDSSFYPSTRRVTRSQRSRRFISLGGSTYSGSASPRKQTFELEVGDVVSPQKLFVTVETEQPEEDASRRLFTSPTPLPVIRRKERTTTTTVPLKGTDDEGNGSRMAAGTPKRRGRPPKSAAGTPKPSASTRKRSGTPIKRTPRQSRKTKILEADEASSESNTRATSKASATKQRAATRTPATSETDQPSSRSTSTRRGRRRRMSLMPEEFIDMADTQMEEDAGEIPPVAQNEPSRKLVEEHEKATPAASSEAVPESDGDIWMATLSDAPTPRASTQTRNTVLSPSPAPTVEEDIDASSVSGSEAQSLEQNDIGPYDVRSETESVVNEIPGELSGRDYDTVKESEDFSMVLMDSLHSLHQGGLNAHATDPQDFGDATNLIINNTLESLRQSADQEPEPVEYGVFANPSLSLPPPPEQPGTPGREAEAEFGSPRPSPQWSKSPRRIKPLPLSRQLLTFKAKQAEDSVSGAPSTTFKGSAPGQKSPRRDSGRFGGEESVAYDDSFSEIPDAVLEAATPRRPTTMRLLQQHEPQPSPLASSSVTANPQSETGRLLTPDDTPSPPAEGDADGSDAKLSSPPSDATLEVIHASHQPSSVSGSLFGTVRTTQHGNEGEKFTPNGAVSTLFDHPAQPPNLLAPQTSSAPQGQRPALSPIVRAGRALQSITSDPPSPVGQRSSLGSPFKDSRGSNGSRPRSGKSTRSVSMPAEAPPSQVYEDPFGQETENSGQPGFVRALAQSVLSSVTRNIPSFRNSIRNSPKAQLPNPDEMSWVADSPSRTEARRRASTEQPQVPTPVRQSSESISLSQHPGPEEEIRQMLGLNGAMDENADGDGEEEDIWAVEAQRATPRSARQKPFGNKAAAGPRRRGKLPSPWNKKEVLGRDQPVASPKKTVQLQADRSELEEYSMLTQAKIPHVPQKKFDIGPRPASKVDLSAFFSSPALIPGAQVAQQARAKRHMADPDVFGPQDLIVNHANSMFPSIRQKSFQPSPEKRVDLFSPAPARRAADEPFQVQESSPQTPEEISFPSVAQKRNFTPRSKQTGQTLFRPGSAGATGPTPPRLLLTREDIERWQEDSAVEDESSNSFVQPLLRPLPAKNVSPTKSSFRSPLKPRTPGRVVEFTSSVLSPLAQAQARAPRRTSIGSAGSFSQPNMFFDNTEADKENQADADVSMTDAPEEFPSKPARESMPQKAVEQTGEKNSVTEPEALSQSIWSRDHWLFMEQLIALRREGPYDFDIESDGFLRQSDRLLGKKVTSRGETMVLEQWHLDVIDAFKAEVGGWAEELLAKRAFALLVCEEARQEGRIEEIKNRRSTAFH
jgi:serine/arginine repetitive matrix protein 2